MVLATDELSRISSQIADSLNEYNIMGASIDLSIGETAKIHTNNRTINLLDGEDFDDIYQEVDLTKGYELLPHQYMYASTIETLSIPITHCGLLFPRSSFARIGLMLPISMYANPGYKGNLPIVIYNASPSKVIIPPYYRVMQLLLLELKGNAKPYNHIS